MHVFPQSFNQVGASVVQVIGGNGLLPGEYTDAQGYDKAESGIGPCNPPKARHGLSHLEALSVAVRELHQPARDRPR